MSETVSQDVGGSGYSLTELGEYLDRRRTPRNPIIESNPECLAALERLAALRTLGGDLLQDDADAHADTGWLDGMLVSIAREARAGRDIPLAAPEGLDTLVVTEGAVKALVRRAGDGVPGVLVGRCRILGEIGVAGAPLDIRVDVSLQPTAPLLALADEVRAAIIEGLALSSGLTVGRVDVRVVDVHVIADGDADADARGAITEDER